MSRAARRAWQDLRGEMMGSAARAVGTLLPPLPGRGEPGLRGARVERRDAHPRAVSVRSGRNGDPAFRGRGGPQLEQAVRRTSRQGAGDQTSGDSGNRSARQAGRAGEADGARACLSSGCLRGPGETRIGVSRQAVGVAGGRVGGRGQGDDRGVGALPHTRLGRTTGGARVDPLTYRQLPPSHVVTSLGDPQHCRQSGRVRVSFHALVNPFWRMRCASRCWRSGCCCPRHL